MKIQVFKGKENPRAVIRNWRGKAYWYILETATGNFVLSDKRDLGQASFEPLQGVWLFDSIEALTAAIISEN